MQNKYAKYRTGSRSVGTNGYVQIGLCNHPLFPGKGFDTEHRVVMAEKLGRRLKRREIVHHKDENKQNNSLRNLELMSQGKHRQHHKKPCSSETRKRISAAKKGRPTPWLLGHKFNLGRKRSTAFKAKVSASMKKLMKTPEHLAAIGNALRGRPLSKAHKAALVVAWKRRKAKKRTLLK